MTKRKCEVWSAENVSNTRVPVQIRIINIWTFISLNSFIFIVRNDMYRMTKYAKYLGKRSSHNFVKKMQTICRL